MLLLHLYYDSTSSTTAHCSLCIKMVNVRLSAPGSFCFSNCVTSCLCDWALFRALGNCLYVISFFLLLVLQRRWTTENHHNNWRSGRRLAVQFCRTPSHEPYHPFLHDILLISPLLANHLCILALRPVSFCVISFVIYAKHSLYSFVWPYWNIVFTLLFSDLFIIEHWWQTHFVLQLEQVVGRTYHNQ